MRVLAIVLCLFFGYIQAEAQFGIGLTASTDIYTRFDNPDEDNADQYGAAGSFLLNLGAGPKIWVGSPRFSFSLESQAQIGLLGLGLKDYKGLGTHSIPVIARLNFGGLTGMDREGKFGWSIGGGIQYNKTELYYLTKGAEDAGVRRDYFRTYVGQVAYGFGLSGFAVQGVLRVGYEPDTKASSINFGVQYDFNIPKLKEISDPASEL